MFNEIKKMLKTWATQNEDKDGFRSVGPCEKDPDQLCSRAIKITRNGTMSQSVEGLTKCCKHWDKTKRGAKAISQLEANVVYNGTSFTQNVIDSKKRTYESMKGVEYVGPMCADNLRKTDDDQ